MLFNCKDDKNTSESQSVIILDDLVLNDGGKWIVNKETHEGVKQMDAIISAFSSDSNTDYKKLGEDLSKQTSSIIKNCNMKGEPHDQLHVVLVPMLDEISILKEQSNPTKSKIALDRLEHLITAYFQHFQL
jgi:hypothetical protein